MNWLRLADRKLFPRITDEDWELVESLLRQEWSLEQISGRLKKEQDLRISHEWIYQHVLADKQSAGDLYQHLRCQKKRRKRYGSYDRRGKLPNCRLIEERPAYVNARKHLGDWEVDTLIGKQQKHAMLALTERKSRFTLLRKVSRRTAQAVQKQVCKLLPVKDKVHTLTSDHGRSLPITNSSLPRFNSNSILRTPMPLGNVAQMKTPMAYCDNTSQEVGFQNHL